jgi:lipid-A-disaccharide synthase
LNSELNATLTRQPKIFICAGEASGDYHGAALAREILQAAPGAEIRGLGGVRMREAGVNLEHGIEELNMMGFGVVFHLRRIFAIMRQLDEAIRAWRPDAVVFIDFPDFNLRLAQKVRAAGLRTVYFIPPKLWAWRSWRVRELRKKIDQLLVIFPFEVEFYKARGLTAEYVGNPLLDDCKATSRLDPEGEPVIALVPGSRRHEIATLLPPMVEAVLELQKTHPKARFVLPAASSVADEALAPAVQAGVTVLRKPLQEVLTQCDFAWVASGTAALEAALAETPFVVVYKVNAFTYQVAKNLIKIKHISLPNILAGKTLVPELLQSDVNGVRLAEEARAAIDDAKTRHAIHQSLREVKRILGEPGAARRAAQAVLRGAGVLTV